jgi:hypothetical protein
MATEAQLEVLITAQNAHFFAQGSQGEARAESRLFDAAVACGMPYNTDDMHGWVAITVGNWLLSGPCDEMALSSSHSSQFMRTAALMENRHE